MIREIRRSLAGFKYGGVLLAYNQFVPCTDVANYFRGPPYPSKRTRKVGHLSPGYAVRDSKSNCGFAHFGSDHSLACLTWCKAICPRPHILARTTEVMFSAGEGQNIVFAAVGISNTSNSRAESSLSKTQVLIRLISVDSTLPQTQGLRVRLPQNR